MQAISSEKLEEFLKTSYISCEFLHESSCFLHFLKKFCTNLAKNAKIFVPLFVIPAIISKRKLIKSLGREILKETLQTSLFSCARTIVFVSLWLSLYKYCMCFSKNLRKTVDST